MLRSWPRLSARHGKLNGLSSSHCCTFKRCNTLYFNAFMKASNVTFISEHSCKASKGEHICTSVSTFRLGSFDFSNGATAKYCIALDKTRSTEGMRSLCKKYIPIGSIADLKIEHAPGGAIFDTKLSFLSSYYAGNPFSNLPYLGIEKVAYSTAKRTQSITKAAKLNGKSIPREISVTRSNENSFQSSKQENISASSLIPFEMKVFACITILPIWFGSVGVHLFAGFHNMDLARLLLSLDIHYSAILLTFMGAFHFVLQMTNFGVSTATRNKSLYDSLRIGWTLVPTFFGIFASATSSLYGPTALYALIAGFTGMLTMDSFAAWKSLTPNWFLRYRMKSTIAIITALLVLLLSESQAIVGPRVKILQ